MSTKIWQPVGADVDNTSTDQKFDLLSRAYGQDGSEFVYVKAAEAVTQYMAVGINKSGNAYKLTKTIADTGDKPAIAQVAFAANDYGWVCVKGGSTTFKVRARNACLPSVALYTSAVAGYLDDTSGSQTLVYGMVLTDTATSSGAAEECFITVEPFTTAA